LTEKTTQTLTGVVSALGNGTGGPNRHPVALQFRLLPVSVEVAAPSVALCPVQDVSAVIVCSWLGYVSGSGVALPPPPK